MAVQRGQREDAEGAQGMSPDTIALAVLDVVGTFGGVWWGQVLEDRRRRQGEVRREVSAWVGATTNTAGGTETRTYDMRFFNDRDVNIALWDVQVEYYREGSLIGTIFPRPTPDPADLVQGGKYRCPYHPRRLSSLRSK
jgi:hypothetical protein